MKILVILFMLVSFLDSNAQCEPFTPSDTVYIGEFETYKSPADYFSEARSDVQVYLREGIYYTGKWLMIDGDHIVIEGLGKANIYCTELYENVMWVSAEHVWIKNLTMKHFKPGTGEGQNCSGRVLGFDNASNITIENCDLNGCGLAGLHDNLGNSDIFVKDNYIHNNSLGAYTDIDGNVWQEEIDDHPVFTFENNRIENNGSNRAFESDTLSTDMMDGVQLFVYQQTIEEWDQNYFGTCGAIMSEEIDSIKLDFSQLEFVVRVDREGKVKLVSFSNDPFKHPTNQIVREFVDCLKESVEYDWQFESPFFETFLRYRYSD